MKFKKVKCKICDKMISRNILNNHLMHIHNISPEQYYLIYILHNKHFEHKCLFCENKTKFDGIFKGYHKICKNKECIKKYDAYQVKKYFKKTYNVENPFQLDFVKKEIEITNLKKYGFKRAQKNLKIRKEISISHKNRTDAQVKESNKKRVKTNNKRYKCDNPTYFGTKKMKKIIKDKYNVENISQTQQWKNKIKRNKTKILNKQYETKRKNNTFSKSKPEENFYKFLISIFNKKDIYRQYNKDSRYPYLCDFYIKSLDMFIELNLYWTHGKHKFNKKSEEDNKTLIKYKKLSKNKKHPQYKTFINVWTVRDVLKLKTAKKNKLKYITLYNLNDISKFKQKIRTLYEK